MTPVTTLLDKTRQMLNHRPRTLTLKMIAKETGLGVPWLKSFSECKQGDYGVIRVETLYTFLTNYKAI